MRGNTRRLSWDGDKEITFHIEDALISPTSMAILTAAQMVRRKVARKEIPSDEIVINPEPYDGTANVLHIPVGSGFDPKTFMSWAKIEVNVMGGTDPVTIFGRDIELIDNPTGGWNLIIDSVDEIIGVETLQILFATAGKPVFKHEKYTVTASTNGELQLKHVPTRDGNHPLFIFDVHDDGSMDLISDIENETGTSSGTGAIGLSGDLISHPDIYAGNDYLVDYYREVKGNVTSLVVTADGTSDYYKLEGETLMRRETDGMDIPVAITIPKVRPRAQFEIPFSSTGDPATFSFDFDVFPARDHNYGACNDNVMVIIDIIEDDEDDCNCVVEELEIWRKNNPTP